MGRLSELRGRRERTAFFPDQPRRFAKSKKQKKSEHAKSKHDRKGGGSEKSDGYPFKGSYEMCSCNGKNLGLGAECDADPDCISDNCVYPSTSATSKVCECSPCDSTACGGCPLGQCCQLDMSTGHNRCIASFKGKTPSMQKINKNDPNEEEECQCTRNMDCECGCCIDLRPHACVCGYPPNQYTHCMDWYKVKTC